VRIESPTWRKSTFSSNGTSCVEVRSDLSAIRDSKNHTGPTLTTTTQTLIATLKAHRFTR
jgi:hypothetical protein